MVLNIYEDHTHSAGRKAARAKVIKGNVTGKPMIVRFKDMIKMINYTSDSPVRNGEIIGDISLRFILS